MGGCCAPGALGATATPAMEEDGSTGHAGETKGGEPPEEDGNAAAEAPPADRAPREGPEMPASAEKRDAALNVEELLRVLEDAVENEYAAMRDRSNTEAHPYQESNVESSRCSSAASPTSVYSAAGSAFPRSSSCVGKSPRRNSPVAGESCATLENDKENSVGRHVVLKTKIRAGFDWAESVEATLESMHDHRQREHQPCAELNVRPTRPIIVNKTYGKIDKLLQQIMNLDPQSNPVQQDNPTEVSTDLDDYPRGSSDTNSEEAERDTKSICDMPANGTVRLTHQYQLVQTPLTAMAQAEDKITRVEATDHERGHSPTVAEPFSRSVKADHARSPLLADDDCYGNWLERHSKELSRKEATHRTVENLAECHRCDKCGHRSSPDDSEVDARGSGGSSRDQGFVGGNEFLRPWAGHAEEPGSKADAAPGEKGTCTKEDENSNGRCETEFVSFCSVSSRSRHRSDSAADFFSFQPGEYVQGSFKFTPDISLVENSYEALRPTGVPSPSCLASEIRAGEHGQDFERVGNLSEWVKSQPERPIDLVHEMNLPTVPLPEALGTPLGRLHQPLHGRVGNLSEWVKSQPERPIDLVHEMNLPTVPLPEALGTPLGRLHQPLHGRVGNLSEWVKSQPERPIDLVHEVDLPTVPLPEAPGTPPGRLHQSLHGVNNRGQPPAVQPPRLSANLPDFLGGVQKALLTPRAKTPSSVASVMDSDGSKLNSRIGTPRSILSAGGNLATHASQKEKVKVCVRMRPFNEHEKVCPLRQLLCVMGKKVVVKEYDRPTVRQSMDAIDTDTLEFTVDHVVDDSYLQKHRVEKKEESQRRMYESIGLPCLKYALDGYNTTIIAYGQVGTGKTYTMMGDGPEEGSGLMSRLAKGLMDQLSTDFRDEFEVQVSYLEIYRERVRDLLAAAAPDSELRESFQGPYSVSASRCGSVEFFADELAYEDSSVDFETASNSTFCVGTPRSWKPERVPTFYFDGPRKKREYLRVREHPVTGPYVEGLLWKDVANWQDLEAAISHGAANRTLAATALNKFSSRGHTVFSIKLIRGRRRFGRGCPSSSFNFINLVDLAGTERPQCARKTSLERQEESRYIHRSLAQLNDVILNLSRNNKFVSYRNSALTWLLRDSLSGNFKLFLIANISPAEQDFQESVNTLRYAAKANRIHSMAAAQPDHKKQLLVSMKKEIQVLHNLVHDLTKSTEVGESELRRRARPQPGFVAPTARIDIFVSARH